MINLKIHEREQLLDLWPRAGGDDKIAKRFLSALVYAHKVNPGLDVGRFMKEYRYVLNGHYNGGNREDEHEEEC